MIDLFYEEISVVDDGMETDSNCPLPARHISLSKEQIDSLELSKSDSSDFLQLHFLKAVMYNGFFRRSATRVIAVAKNG